MKEKEKSLLKKLLFKKRKKKKMAVLIDLTNVGEENRITLLNEIKALLLSIPKMRTISMIKIFLGDSAPEGIIEMFMELGVPPVIVPEHPDIYLAYELVDISHSEKFDGVILYSCNKNILPALSKIKESDKELLVILSKHDEIAEILRSIADQVLQPEPPPTEEQKTSN
ncbi:MAG: NYN domain-containing protein [Candidatus Baldrarchaeia archaeon]